MGRVAPRGGPDASPPVLDAGSMTGCGGALRRRKVRRNMVGVCKAVQKMRYGSTDTVKCEDVDARQD